MNVVLIVDIQDIDDKVKFEKHLKREGFLPIEDEDFAYEGEAHTHLFNTRAFILEVVSKGLSKVKFGSCNIIFQIGENPMEAYRYMEETRDFMRIEV